MLMVAPRGSTKEATSFRAPSRSEHSRVKGRVPTEDAEEKAIIMAGAIPLKKAMGDTPPRAFTVLEYTTTAWTI